MGATTTTTTGDVDVDELEARLADGADELTRVRRSILQHPQLLIGIAATLMTTGVAAIILGWLGAAHATLIEEQFPYLISGGLLGVALSTIGALLFFTHWLTVAIKEARQHEARRRDDHEQLVSAVQALTAALTTQGKGADGNARSAQPRRQVRRTPRSS